MSTGDAMIILALAILIAIPLAWVFHRLAHELQMRKHMKLLRRAVPNIEPADGFKLHSEPVVRKPRRRPPNVVPLKRPPKEAA